MREEILILLQNTLNAHGAQSLMVSKFTPSIVTGLSDSQVQMGGGGGGTWNWEQGRVGIKKPTQKNSPKKTH